MPRPSRPLPPLAILKQTFRYNPKTGAIWNRISRTSRKAGERADGISGNRYRMVYVAGQLHYAHRIAWCLAHGCDPPDWIDHKNRDRLDNRLSNLRAANHSLNICNSKTRSDNTSGAKGVHRRKDNGKWRAFITVDGKRTWLGQFNTFKEAQAVARDARLQLDIETP